MIKHHLIHHCLEESARTLPNKCAMVHGNVRLSYGELNSDANCIARWLIDRGLKPGDRVVLFLENCREYLAGYYGCLKAGGVAVPLNPDLKKESLIRYLTETTPRAIISSSKCERTLRELDFPSLAISNLLIARPKLQLGFGRDLAEIIGTERSSNPEVSMDETGLAGIIFTSGSTGKPKGVMLTHRNIVANTRSIISFLELTDADIQMVVLPFFYVMGKSLLNTHMAIGGTVVINNQFAYPTGVIQQMIDEGVTGFSGVPSTFAYLLHRSPLKSVREKLTSLRYCSQAGGHMARHTKEELLKVIPEHTKLYVMYGATEAAARLTYVEPHRLREKIDSIGIPIPEVGMKVLDEQGNELPQREIGELVANGPNIMVGYWNDPDSGRNALSRHGYHTGDMGYRDEEGYFYVLGRRDNQLKVGGHRVDPKEIEDALIATNLIIECAVLGIPDQLAGHRLVAVAVSRNGETSERDILAFCVKIFPRHKLPSEICFVKLLPKNGSGKIDRGACMVLISQEENGYRLADSPRA